MAQKGLGEGYVFFNKQRKKWNAQYRDYDINTGTLKLKTKSFKTKEEAKKYLSTIMYQKENPIYVEHHGIPLCELMRANLKFKLDTNLITATQFSRVSTTIGALEKLPIGNKKIDEITSTEIQTYLNSISNLSNSSIKKIYGQFVQAFKTAMNKGYIMKNPMNTVIRPISQKQDKKVRALTLDEQQAFTDYLLTKDIKQCKYKNVFLIQMYMGLRVGEALALTMNDVDLKNKKINIHRTLTTDENNETIMENKTKTYAGMRVVPIPEVIYPYVIEQMNIANTQYNNDEKLLFKPLNHNYTKRTNVNSELHRILKREFDITDISTHSLRHTFGTRCIESGMAPVVVQRLMGHTDIGVTLNTYTSVFDKFKENEVNKVNQYYLNNNLVSNNTNLIDSTISNEHEK
mgnify:FL=1